jgi:hypothetical protein
VPDQVGRYSGNGDLNAIAAQEVLKLREGVVALAELAQVIQKWRHARACGCWSNFGGKFLSIHPLRWLLLRLKRSS